MTLGTCPGDGGDSGDDGDSGDGGDGGDGPLYVCDFETLDLCGMIQSTDDSDDWIQHSGSTGSSGTGPSAAVTGQGYIYLEASNIANGELVR